MHSDPPVFPGRLDPNERFRERRRRSRRRRRLRGLAIVAVLCGVVVALALNARFITGGEERAVTQEAAATTTTTPAAATTEAVTGPPEPRLLPEEVRGVHVTMPLASIPGKIDGYLDLADDGLTAIEIDVKDENGEIAFAVPGAPLAGKVGAVGPYYDPRAVADKVHEAGVYLIGRVVVFEDPKLAAGRPQLAVKTRDGGVWRDTKGLGWTNPYDERVWEYNVAVAAAAAEAGFDEIMFDYVRFPSDGNISSAVFGGATTTKTKAISAFVEYASERLKPLGVRVSAALFGLAATRDLGIGQRPRKLAQFLDTVYPMVYPSHFGSGEFNIADPNAQPGRTVSFALLDYRNELSDRSANIVPWLQDFSLGGTYTLEDVAEQIRAARRARVGGFMLWNPAGVYTDGALSSG